MSNQKSLKFLIVLKITLHIEIYLIKNNKMRSQTCLNLHYPTKELFKAYDQVISLHCKELCLFWYWRLCWRFFYIKDMILSHPSLISNYFHPVLDTCTAKLMAATVNIGLRKKIITLTFLFIQIAQSMSSSFMYVLESLFRIQIRVNYFDNKTKIKRSFIKRFVIFYQEIRNMYKFKLGWINIYYS